jgi:hypothetical protein
MLRKILAGIVVSMLGGGVAAAGPIGPTWAESVMIQATPNPNGPGLITNVYAYVISPGEAGLYYTYNRYDGAYTSYGVLLDYQGGVGEVDVLGASLSAGLSGSVPLNVTEFAGSPTPYVPDLSDAEGGYGYSIQTGDYTAFPIALSFDATAGPVAFLLTTGLSPSYDIYEGVASYVTLSVVPEPSSIAMLPVGIGFVLACLARRKKRRPGPRGLAGR